MTQTPQHTLILQLLEQSRDHLFVTGKAGTGKTTLLQQIARQLSEANHRVALTASTGTAAIHMGGVTLHSLLGIPLAPHLPDQPITNALPPHKAEVLQAIDTLIIDEVSMVRPDTLDFADQRLRQCRKSDIPFGGVRLILFGDLHQLPPVVLASERPLLRMHYLDYHFFHAKVWLRTHFKMVELTEVFRQQDLRFVELLGRIRSGSPTPEDLDILAELRNPSVCKGMTGSHIHLCAFRKEAERINLQMLRTPTHAYQAVLSGSFNINNAPCEETLQLRIGARVMLLTNHPKKYYCNGSLGVVVGMDEVTVAVKLDSGLTVPITANRWEERTYVLKDGKLQTEIKGDCVQMPLTLAWAMTIHKSQGLTFDRVAVHAPKAFCAGQIYVALSRCRTLEGLALSSFIDHRHLLPDPWLYAFEQVMEQTGGRFDIPAYRQITESLHSF